MKKKITLFIISMLLFLTIGVRNVNAEIKTFNIEFFGREIKWSKEDINEKLGNMPDMFVLDLTLTRIKGEEEIAILNKRIELTDESYDLNKEIDALRDAVAGNDNGDDEFRLYISLEAYLNDDLIGKNEENDENIKHFYRVDSVIKTLDAEGKEVDPKLGGSVSEKAYYFEDEQASFEVNLNEGYDFEAYGNYFDTTSINEKETFFLGSHEKVEVTFIPMISINIDFGENHVEVGKNFVEYLDDTPVFEILNPKLNASILTMNVPVLYNDGDSYRKATFEDYRFSFYNILFGCVDDKEKYLDKNEYLCNVSDKKDDYKTIMEEEINKEIKEGDTFYVIWLKPLDIVDVSIEELECGTNIISETKDEIATQNIMPKITINSEHITTKTVFSEDGFAYWVSISENEEEEYELYNGIIKHSNGPMKAMLVLGTEGGYYVTEDTKILVNGKEVSERQILGTLFIVIADVDVKHDYVWEVIKNASLTEKGTEVIKVPGTDEIEESREFDYVISNDEQTYEKGSNIDLTLTFNRSVDDESTYDKFESLSGIEKYELSKGSLNIIIPSSYLESLNNGTYTIDVAFKDGLAKASFNIIGEEKKKDDDKKPIIPDTSVKH